MPTVLEGLWEEIEARREELHGKRVRVIVLDADEPPVGSLERLFRTLEEIHTRLEQAGHVPPTDEEAFERIEKERQSWDR